MERCVINVIKWTVTSDESPAFFDFPAVRIKCLLQGIPYVPTKPKSEIKTFISQTNI